MAGYSPPQLLLWGCSSLDVTQAWLEAGRQA